MFTKESAFNFFQAMFAEKLCYRPSKSSHDEVMQDIKTLKENLVIWHNLEENPDDVPKTGKDVVAKMHYEFRDCITHYNPDTGYWEDGTPIAWFEYPEFIKENK